MKPISIPRIILLLSVVFNVSCSKKAVDSVYPPDITEAREWLRENGGMFKREELQINLSSGEKIIGKLDWEEAIRLCYKGRDYIDIPYVFPQYEKILPGSEKIPPVSYNLVFRKNIKGEYEGALRTTQYHVMAENLTIGGDQPVMLQSYQSMDGKPLNMWLGNEGGENYKIAEEIYLSPNQIAAIGAKSKMAITKEGNTVARRAAPNCETYKIDTYENKFYYANAYDESIGNVTVQRIHRTITMTVCHPVNDFNNDYYLPVTGSEGGGGNWSSNPIESNSIYTQQEAIVFINELNNPLTGDPIEFYLVAEYTGSKLLDLSKFSVGIKSMMIKDYTLTPHYDNAGNLIFYTASRLDASIGIEYIVRADALNDFRNKIDFYLAMSNLVYSGGVPSQSQILLAAGKTFEQRWEGLKGMWSDAVHSAEWWAFTVAAWGGSIKVSPSSSIATLGSDGYYTVNGFRFTKYYYEYLWINHRGGATLLVEDIVTLGANSKVVDLQKPGFYKYQYGGWELVYNPSTKEVWHILFKGE